MLVAIPLTANLSGLAGDPSRHLVGLGRGNLVSWVLSRQRLVVD
jgi:hypothetical protein